MTDTQLASFMKSHSVDTTDGTLINVDATHHISLQNVKVAQLTTDDFHLI
jgi:hypothetical protein